MMSVLKLQMGQKVRSSETSDSNAFCTIAIVIFLCNKCYFIDLSSAIMSLIIKIYKNRSNTSITAIAAPKSCIKIFNNNSFFMKTKKCKKKIYTFRPRNVVFSAFKAFIKITLPLKNAFLSLFLNLSFLKFIQTQKIRSNIFIKNFRDRMKIIEKYTNLILQKGYAETEEQAELLADTLYQLAFTVVQNYQSIRRN